MPQKKRPTNKNPRKNNKKDFTQKPVETIEVHEITYPDGITVGELAEKINKQSSDIIKVLCML